MTEIRILIIGGASLDTLDGADGLVAGGAGMYTAMASQRSGAQVTLYAPRPEPVPEALHAVAERVTWLGPSVSQENLPRFEIRYRDGHAIYLSSTFGAEDALSPDGLPEDLSEFHYVHLVPLGDMGRQLSFLRACRERGARKISAGTALHLIQEQPGDAAAVLDEADVFFMNEAELTRMFGSSSAARSKPGQLIFVTRGPAGAMVIQGETTTELAGVGAKVVDPTGAGDTFCGATLVGLALGRHPVMAARHAMPLAAQLIEDIGPVALLRPSPAPQPAPDERVVVNAEQTRSIATLIAGLPEVTPFAFTGPDLPQVDHPATVDYFFASTLQQFGFWTSNERGYERPLVATLAGEERKGAFYLFRAYLRWLENDPEMLTPARQAALSKAELQAVLRADDGSDPMPALDLHLSMANSYGRDMLALEMTPQAMLQWANASSSPLHMLVQLLDHVGGYKEDPLRKKAVLLAIILQQRPEAFLATDATGAPPVVDYHVMRSCLRTGLIDVRDEALAAKIVARELLSEDEEWAVRAAAYSAVGEVVAKSGKSMGAVDWFFFQARQRCPEMSEPRCGVCAVDPACAHRKELFQPVRRTSFY